VTPARYVPQFNLHRDGAPRGDVGGLLAVSAHGSGGPTSLGVRDAAGACEVDGHISGFCPPTPTLSHWRPLRC
jgi:hypothetical protein